MASGASPRKKRSARQRMSFVRPSSEMKRIFAMLGDELLHFPDVTTRKMFGFTSYYRRGVIFAALPLTRAMGSRNAFMFKLNSAPERLLSRARNDPHIVVSKKGLAGWQTFSIEQEYDIAGAQGWLIDAWRYALKMKARK